uniref:glycosyltransferase family 9 protein n=1 Tax=Nitrospira cf. moscoviensis SBR1015 TaxID=96242 RepID=UPI000A3978C6|nr:glycosyltransferase family 9 protein [Nitrospira cf. moscoviensis SBR1015]
MRDVVSPRGATILGEPLFQIMGRRRKQEVIDLKAADRILVIRLDDIGDMILSTPFLRELRRAIPSAKISLIVKPSVAELAVGCPFVNEVLSYDPGPPSYAPTVDRMTRIVRFAVRYLWLQRFDLAIVPRWDADLYHASYLAYWSGAAWRVGYSENVIPHKRAMNAGFDRLYSHVLVDRSLKHEVERGLDILRFIGGNPEKDGLVLWGAEQREQPVSQVLANLGVSDGTPLIAFGIGAASPTRQWPCEQYIELGRWIRKEYDARIVIVGGPADVESGRMVTSSLGQYAINAVDRITWHQLGPLLKSCSLYVGNDSGPMHVAAAAGVPVIEISCHPSNGNPFWSNSPLRFGPWGVPSQVLQPEAAVSPCEAYCTSMEAHCIRRIGIERVKDAVRTCVSQQCQPAVA